MSEIFANNVVERVGRWSVMGEAYGLVVAGSCVLLIMQESWSQYYQEHSVENIVRCVCCHPWWNDEFLFPLHAGHPLGISKSTRLAFNGMLVSTLYLALFHYMHVDGCIIVLLCM